MRIWMVVSVLAPLGGIEAALVPLATELKAQGHEVSVYTVRHLDRPNQNAEALESAGITISSTPVWLDALAQAGLRHHAQLIDVICCLAAPVVTVAAVANAWRRGRTIRRALQGGFGRLRGSLATALDFEGWSYRRLGHDLRESPADVVHVHGWGCGVDPPGAMRWLRRQNYPIAYTEHSSLDPVQLSPMDAAPMNLGHVLIAVSQAGEEGLRLVGRAEPPVMIIPYSIAPLSPGGQNAHRAFTLVCVARLHPQKGHPVLLEALAQMVAQLPEVQLLLAGMGETRPDLEAQVTKLGLEKNVTFVGLVSRSDLPALLARADVVVLPSHWEGLPVTLIEALSAGKAIVASSVGGIPELVLPGVNGLLVPAGDAPALARALLVLAGDPGLVARMGLASRERFAIGGFTPAAVAAKHLQAYHLAINHSRAAFSTSSDG